MNEKIAEVFNRVFAGKVEFRPGLDRTEVALWDSMKHVELMVGLEKEFGVRFNGADAVAMSNTYIIIKTIEEKLGA